MQKSKNEKKNKLVVIDKLDDRKEVILLTIIKIYLETGEPVGSRTISKKLEVELSSATIRNEMSDLEELGYIIKPHTSAGRIPSDKGYRYYVDNLIKEKESEIRQLKTEMTKRVDKLEDMLKTVVKTIAANTNYAAMIAGPSINNSKIVYVQLSKLEGKKVLVVTVAEGNVVKTAIIDTESSIDAEELIDISTIINNLASGSKVSELNDRYESVDKNKIKKNKKDVDIIIDAIIKSFNDVSVSDNIWTSGSNNFFKYKEFTEGSSVSELIETFEQKKDLAKLISKASEDNDKTGLSVYIGEETPVNAMKDCSVITANCDFGNGMKGTIGVVGPKRMDYEKVLKTIKNTMANLSKDL